MEHFKAYTLTETPERKIRAEFVEMTLDELDPGDVVVRVAYSDVNYKDALAATGKGRILRRPACIGGIDLAGTVVSSSDPRFAKGDAVMGIGYDLGVSHDGGYAQYARVPGDWLAKLPQGHVALGCDGVRHRRLHRRDRRRAHGARRPQAGERAGDRQRRHRRRRLDRARRARAPRLPRAWR